MVDPDIIAVNNIVFSACKVLFAPTNFKLSIYKFNLV